MYGHRTLSIYVERRQTKGLMSRTIAVYVRYNSWYISLPSSAKLGPILRFLNNVFWTATANFLKFYFKFIAVSQIQFRDSFDSDKQSKWTKSIPRFEGKI